MCWLVPPFHLIGRVLSHALEGRVSGTIVVPEWPAQAWWPLLLAVGRDMARLDAEAFQAGPTGRVEPWGTRRGGFGPSGFDRCGPCSGYFGKGTAACGRL